MRFHRFHPFEWLDDLTERDPINAMVLELTWAFLLGLAFSRLLAWLISLVRLYPTAPPAISPW